MITRIIFFLSSRVTKKSFLCWLSGKSFCFCHREEIVDEEFNFDDDVFVLNKDYYYGEIRFQRDNFLPPQISN